MKPQKIYKFNFILSKPDYHQGGIIDLRIKTPDQHHLIMVPQRKSRGPMRIPPPGEEMGQQITKMGWKEKWMDNSSLLCAKSSSQGAPVFF